MAEQQASSGGERDPRAARGASARRACRMRPRRTSRGGRRCDRGVLSAAAFFGLWTAGIQARLVYLQVIEHADMQARADRQHMRTITAPAKRGEIVDRNGHVLAYSVDADSVFADPSEIESPDKVAQLVCGALDDCGARERQEMAQNLRRDSQFVYLARKVSPDEAQRVQGAGAEGRRLHQGEPALLSEEGAGGARARLRRARQHRPRRPRVDLRHAGARPRRQDPGSDRRAAPRAQQPRRSAGHRRRGARADHRSVPPAHRRARAARRRRGEPRRRRQRRDHGSATRGEILALANWPTFNPNAFGRADDRERRNRAIQDLYEPGSTFKVVTASAALEEARHPARRLGRLRPGLHQDSAAASRSTTSTATACCRSPTSSSSRATSARSRSGCASDRSGSGATSAASASARRWPGLPRREPRHRLEPGQAERQRAGLGVDGIPGRRDAAADGGGGQLGRQWRLADGAARRPRVHQGRPARRRSRRRCCARRCRRRRSPSCGRSWKASSSAARRSRRRSPATPSPARPGPRPSSSTAATRSRNTTPRSSASFRRASRR